MAPFVGDERDKRSRRCEEILSIQAMGLKKRLEHTGSQHAVVGFQEAWIPPWPCL